MKHRFLHNWPTTPWMNTSRVRICYDNVHKRWEMPPTRNMFGWQYGLSIPVRYWQEVYFSWPISELPFSLWLSLIYWWSLLIGCCPVVLVIKYFKYFLWERRISCQVLSAIINHGKYRKESCYMQRKKKERRNFVWDLYYGNSKDRTDWCNLY